MERTEIPQTTDPKRIAITGATGLIGSALSQTFVAQGHTVHRVVRGEPTREDDIYWDLDAGDIAIDALEGVDIVIHLAGENLFGCWSDAKKREILDSRTRGTSLLARALTELKKVPEVFISTSAVGVYGNTGERVVDERSAPGDTFLAEVCKQWEAASESARQAGIRTVNPRLGVVLSKHGGTLKLMATPFKFGLGGHIGDGEQYMSWITREDLVRAFE